MYLYGDAFYLISHTKTKMKILKYNKQKEMFLGSSYRRQYSIGKRLGSITVQRHDAERKRVALCASFYP